MKHVKTTLPKDVRLRIYKRISSRYKTRAKKLGQNWKEVQINGKNFVEAYESELKREEYKLSLGKEPSQLRRPSRDVEEETDPFKIFKIDPKDKGIVKKRSSEEEFFDDARGVRLWSDEEPREVTNKRIEREINKQLEEACFSGICPRCKSSVCRCYREEDEE